MKTYQIVMELYMTQPGINYYHYNTHFDFHFLFLFFELQHLRLYAA